MIMIKGNFSLCPSPFFQFPWLDDDEIKKLFDAVELSPNQNLKDLIHFSLNFGCRKPEALDIRWMMTAKTIEFIFE